ncbi:FAD binding domain-containing protein [Fischerella sp. PCC 9605]|uniref:FAD binding domain-containing protein n=1 Tax=Fischerella sp. PCC 9605 TaxID=1173024 RepID=UPI00047D9E75|nr:FAD binding domain-containing protein [Fischerella sp. PCC 9605]
MDLLNIKTYLRPHDVQTISNWGEGWAWLAGGTWIFSEPQPHLKVLVDIQCLDWSEIEVQEDNLVIGATCPLIKLLHYPWPSEWTAVEGFKSAISALAASLKVINMATVGGNICLALSVGTIAPIMVALNATYEIWNLNRESRQVAAKEFQLGSRQTILQPSEILRRVLIPVENLKWQVNYQRFGIAASDPALAIAVSACNPDNLQLRCAIAASVPAPRLLELKTDVETLHPRFLQDIDFIDNAKASATYRREVTQVLIRRSLQQLKVF